MNATQAHYLKVLSLIPKGTNPMSVRDMEEIVRTSCRNNMTERNEQCETCLITNNEKCWERNVTLVCPTCHLPLIKLRTTIEGVELDCAWTCLMLECRKDKLEAPVFYGYTQEDINNNLIKD
jgi:hypothetical protein